MRLRWPFGSLRRDLKSELKAQSTEDYWRQRERSRLRRFQLVSHIHRLESLTFSTRESIGILRGAIFSLLTAFAFGGLSLGAILAIEIFLATYVESSLVPSGNGSPPLSGFPTLAVQVSASLLGFYLASVSIVLGTSYHSVSADVRALILGSARVRFHLRSIGLAIGTGLGLVLLKSLGFSYGYLTVLAYALLVVISGWSLFQLAFGAFNLFNPIVLSQDPLRVLYGVIRRLGSKSLTGDEAVLRATSQKANRSLRILAELIELTSNRTSIDRSGLANMVENTLILLQLYAQRKHLLAPTSAWFISEPVYPKWVEANYSEVSIALKTSTPLRPRIEPATGWLEARTAEVVSAALEACVSANGREEALRITRGVASTSQVLARCYRLEDAITFSRIVRDRCWAIQAGNPAAVAVASQPPLILASLLLGWRDALVSWPEEIGSVVDATKWDSRRTSVVAIRGSENVWHAAQKLLQEVKAEHDIEGRRVTPCWYLRFSLANAALFSLRKFASELPKLLDDFVCPTLEHPSSTVMAMIGVQALQAHMKAQLVAEDILQAVEGLEKLRRGNAPLPVDECSKLSERLLASKSAILERTADALMELHPERPQSEPDLFGEAFFALVHHTEEAIKRGDATFVGTVFPRIINSTFRLEDYLLATYKPPTYQYNAAILDPIVDLLELSGMAVIYATIRNDRSDDPVRRAWDAYVKSHSQPEDRARQVLGFLDLADGNLSFGMSQRSILRTEWEIDLANHIVEAGYGCPEYIPYEELPVWNAPILIKMLGVSTSSRSLDLKPRTIFAAEVIGPLSAEPVKNLRERSGIRRYYELRDFHAVQGVSTEAARDDTGCREDNS